MTPRPGYPALLFDLDGTLLDPRPRMLRTVHAFGRPEVRLEEVRTTWQDTARALGLDPTAFFETWNEVFWDPSSFALDRPIHETVWCARWAESLGVPNIILTGRTHDTRAATRDQLARLCLSPLEVITKPGLDAATPEFKRDEILALLARGVALGAFVTDSAAEIEAVRAAVPDLACILCALEAADSSAAPRDVPLWRVTSGLDEHPAEQAKRAASRRRQAKRAASGTRAEGHSRSEAQASCQGWKAHSRSEAEASWQEEEVVLPAGMALSPRILHGIAEELGGDLSRLVVSTPIVRRSEFDALCRAAGWDLEEALAALDRNRRAACEHFLNDRDGRARVLDGDLDPAIARGELFDLPLVRLSAERARVLRSTRLPVAPYEGFFAPPGGDCLLPVHPQELRHRPRAARAGNLEVRATASGRTVHAHLPGAPHMLLKCDLSHVFMDRHRRSLTLDDARRALSCSDFLAACVRDDDVFSFFPEVFAVADHEEDLACVVRSPDSLPPGPEGAWTIPSYCLWAPAYELGAPEPLVVRVLRRMGADALLEVIVGPLVVSMARLMFDFGSSFLGHGQNIHLEIGRDGLPTGRFVFSDMEDVWVHPDLRDALRLPVEIDEAYRLAHAESVESDIAHAFQDHFVWKLLHPLLRCVEESSLGIGSVRREVNERIRSEVRARKDLVHAFRNGALAWFFETYL